MGGPAEEVEILREKIRVTEKQLGDLQSQLATLEKSIQPNSTIDPAPIVRGSESPKWPLLPEEYKRYARQMIVPQVGLKGQQKLKDAKVLVVGAGGLGCPAAAYLAGAGVGSIGLMDGDVVEISNLHRQILHTTANVGMHKVDSAIEYLKGLNSLPTYHAHRTHLNPSNALPTFTQYTHILDCTDNPASRYLISDTCILLSLPLISASALRTDGQLTVLNHPPAPQGSPAGGPCYRCIYPQPPPAAAVTSCGDGGIIGPVVGTMGVLQALECLKLITAEPAPPSSTPPKPSLLLFSANPEPGPTFRTVRLRTRRVDCFACSSTGRLTRDSLTSGSLDYDLFCGLNIPGTLLRKEERISARDYAVRYRRAPHADAAKASTCMESGAEHLLIDVREAPLFNIAHLPHSINIPFSTFPSPGISEPVDACQPIPSIPETLTPETSIVILCARGNDSQVVVKMLKEKGYGEHGKRWIGDIEDGLRGWREQVDGEWPDF